MDPILRFIDWMNDAKNEPRIADASVMCLATVDAKGQPSARMVLLKSVDARGFVFYTNLESRKGLELKTNPHAALCFYWEPMGKQVRVEGKVELVSDKEADEYFKTRPRDSQLGAWISKQSTKLESRDALLKAVADKRAEFEGKEVPRPKFWSGFRLVPNHIEFWEQGEARLHDRQVYTRQGDGWEMTRLYP